jgi:hypothetical protein
MLLKNPEFDYLKIVLSPEITTKKLSEFSLKNASAARTTS